MAPSVGVVPVIDGATVSGPLSVVNRASTQ